MACTLLQVCPRRFDDLKVTASGGRRIRDRELSPHVRYLPGIPRDGCCRGMPERAEVVPIGIRRHERHQDGEGADRPQKRELHGRELRQRELDRCMDAAPHERGDDEEAYWRGNSPGVRVPGWIAFDA
jgi:hypothetical protein